MGEQSADETMSDDPDPQGRQVAFVLKGYPRLSETFIAQEILALQQQGLDLLIYSLRHPTDKAVHELNRKITAPVTYLPEYLYQEPRRVFRAWQAVRKLPGYAVARQTWTRDLIRDPSSNRIRRFGQAMVLAHEAPESVFQMHAHFIHTPGSVTRYAAMIRDLPWSVSAHAKDIWTLPKWELSEKLNDCLWAVTCTAANVTYLETLAPPEKVQLVYHGLDFKRFPKTERSEIGNPVNRPIVILSVGRAVVKKGYDVLLNALAELPDDIAWSFVHIGGGPLRDTLEKQAKTLNISERTAWRGAQSQDIVLQAYKEADIFALASRVAEDGDRDGLPNVLMEAQSQGLPCISTTVSAIPELVTNERTGLLVAPESTEEMTAALEKLCRSADLRQQLGDAGEQNVRDNFTLDHGIETLKLKFSNASSASGEE
jgi:glycosyltransferase involved in cell wall biosynthesis